MLVIITAPILTLFIIYMVDEYVGKALKIGKKGDNLIRPTGRGDNINSVIESVNDSISSLLITSEAIKEQTRMINSLALQFLERAGGSCK